MTQMPLPPAIAFDLQQVHQIVQERMRSRSAVISAVGASLTQPGQRRLRATLVLLAAALGDYQSERVLHAAAAVELIHAATQTHDGLVDEAERRRGQPPTGEWGNGVALMVGDYLFALAAGEMALSPDLRVISFYSQAVLRICEGELAPLANLRPLAEARARYIERVGDTVGALMAAACKAGGVCGRLAPEQIDTLGRYGASLGLALQLEAEASDFAREAINGAEPSGASLRRGTISMPLIYAADAGDGDRLSAALDSSDPAELAWAVAEVRRLGVPPTRDEAARAAAAALDALAALPAGPARDTLAALAQGG